MREELSKKKKIKKNRFEYDEKARFHFLTS